MTFKSSNKAKFIQYIAIILIIGLGYPLFKSFNFGTVDSILDTLLFALVNLLIGLSFLWLYLELVPNTQVMLNEEGLRQLIFPKRVIRWEEVTLVKIYAFSIEIYSNKKKIIVYVVLFDDLPQVVQLIKRKVSAAVLP